MRRFIAQVVVNTLTILIVLFIFSLIKVDYTDPFTGLRFTGPALALGTNPLLTLLFMALFVALVGAFVRPIILVLTGRLLLRSMGLILIVVNVVLVAVASWLAPGEFVVAQPTWFWGTLIALVFTLLASGIQIVVGIDRPQIDVSDRQRAIWRLLDRLPTPRRSKLVENLRLMQVYNTVASFGLEIGLESTPVAVIRDRFQKLIGGMNRELAALSTPAKVRVMLQQLGPTYVKIGQMVSSRAEALPDAWQEELAKLQNTVPPFPAAKAHEMIEAELHQPASELYATFDEEALAAASLAQVHRATLPDGREVVVKIQRPDVQTMVAADLGVMQDLAERHGGSLRAGPPPGRQGNPRGVRFRRPHRARLPQRGVPHAAPRREHGQDRGRAGSLRRRRAERPARAHDGVHPGRQDQRRRRDGGRGHRPRRSSRAVSCGRSSSRSSSTASSTPTRIPGTSSSTRATARSSSSTSG